MSQGLDINVEEISNFVRKMTPFNIWQKQLNTSKG